MSLAQRQHLAAALRANAAATTAPGTLADQRAAFAEWSSHLLVPADIRTEETRLAGLRTLLVRPAAEDARRPGTLLYFHGGGWVVGSPETALTLTGNLVTRTGVTAYSVDYRLAPEHPFPAAIEDGLAAYRALLDAGHAPASIVLAGDSAGGGLAVGTLLTARDTGLPLPAGAVLFSPGLDATRTGRSMETKEGVDPIFTRAALDATGALYRGDADPHQPLLSPAVLADPTGFPPLLIQVGTDELLLDDSTRFAERARAAEVDVILDVTAGVPHVFPLHAGTLDEADQALDRAALFITQRLPHN